MKLGISLIALMVAGCAMEPPTPYQRQLMLHQMSRPAYQLPQPTVLQVPQYQTPMTPNQPINFGNPGQNAATSPMPQPQRPAGYTLSDCKTTPMGTLLCQQR